MAITLEEIASPPDPATRCGVLVGAPSSPYPRGVMFLMFVVWFVAFIGIFRGWRWVPVLVLANLVYTLVVLKVHMTDPIPLNF